MSTRIRLACLIDSVGHRAGTENQLIQTLERIDTDQFEVHLCCLEPSDRLQQMAARVKTAVFPVETVYSASAIQRCFQLNRYLKNNRIEILHTFMVKSNILGVFAARGAGCRAVLSSRRNLGYWYSPVYKVLFRYINSRTTRIVANSARVRSVVTERESVPLAKIDVHYNGVDMDAFTTGATGPTTRLHDVADGRRIVGIVANLRPVKDIPLFLRAAAIVASQVPDAAFAVVGRGSMQAQLEALVAELRIQNQVIFAAGEGNVAEYLRDFSVGCLSSASEGFSNAILEYMAAGLPVVATDVGGNAEAVENGVTGFIVKERSPEAFAAPILMLLSDDARRKAMGEAGRQRCRSLFDADRTVRELETYYRGLARGSHG